MVSSLQRQEAVLRAIVQDYVDKREPVGSKALVQRHNFSVSPATIRNDMAVLEELGLIWQPHTSAGRIPTDRGYRRFVDSLRKLEQLSEPERRAITDFLDAAVDFDDVAERTVRLLAQLTNSLAVMQYPSLRQTVLIHVEIVVLSEQRILLLIVTASGRVVQRNIEIPAGTSEETVTQLRQHLNILAGGNTYVTLKEQMEDFIAHLPKPERELAQVVSRYLTEAMESENEAKIVTAGAAHLGREPEIGKNIGALLDAIEEQVVLLRLFANMDNNVAVSIGEENGDEALAYVSVVTSTYGEINDGQSAARLGIVGPTRMNYASTISAVRAVAAYLTRFVQEKV